MIMPTGCRSIFHSKQGFVELCVVHHLHSWHQRNTADIRFPAPQGPRQRSDRHRFGIASCALHQGLGWAGAQRSCSRSRIIQVMIMPTGCRSIFHSKQGFVELCVVHHLHSWHQRNTADIRFPAPQGPRQRSDRHRFGIASCALHFSRTPSAVEQAAARAG